jgi:mono/diheme cytochrome c family protein
MNVRARLNRSGRSLAAGASLFLALLIVTDSPAPALAQTATTGSGAGSGAGGVFTREQANAGKLLYDIECSLCHAPREFFGPVFQRRWLTPPVGGLFVHILNTMPQDAPGSLSPTQVANLVAYILEMNGHPAGARPLPTALEQLSQIRLPPPDTARR